MKSEDPNTLIDVRNINEKVYNFIKSKIINSTFPPGYSINLSQMSQQLGVSHTPIKDALFQLAGEGLVEIAPRKGTYVKDITPQDIHEILQVRIFLETAVVEEITAGLTDEQIFGFTRQYEKMISLVANEDDEFAYKAYMERDSKFHLLFFQILGNQRLLRIYQNLNAHMQIVRFRLLSKRGKSPSTNLEHANILKALQERNPGNAKEAVRRHLLSIDNTLRAIHSHQDDNLIAMPVESF